MDKKKEYPHIWGLIVLAFLKVFLVFEHLSTINPGYPPFSPTYPQITAENLREYVLIKIHIWLYTILTGIGINGFFDPIQIDVQGA